MTPEARVLAANVVIVVGLLPTLAWLVMLPLALGTLRSGDFGLPDLMFAGVAGMGAYLFTFLISGAGAVWAAILARTAPRGARRAAKVLISITAAVLLLPWLAVLVLVAARHV
jgi:hypothetical protein